MTSADAYAPFTWRLADAFGYAAELHREQRRKGTSIPYLAHLMAVAAIVIEVGGDEDQAIAALLHDAVEDQGGQPTLEEIGRRYGERVAAIVLACSDTDIKPKPPWRARKETYIAHLPTSAPDALLVSLADKLHNARAILFDYRAQGDALWAKFDPASDQLWYYGSLVSAFRSQEVRLPTQLVDELDRTVQDLTNLVSST
jgi:GTP pyrophosphokinase